MPKITPSVTVNVTSDESNKNEAINCFIRGRGMSILPRNYENNETLKAMFQSDDDDQNGGDDRGN